MKKSTIFYNCTINKKELKNILTKSFSDYGKLKTSFLATKLKDLGFHYATQGGVSISIEDLRVPPTKNILTQGALKKVDKAKSEASQGKITEVERYQKVIDIWNTTSESLKERVVEYFKTKDPLNSVYMMAFSGARGNVSQVRQLVGMRGLMADPSGQIIDIPITANFREGLTVSDYIISSYGARKGLVDTALRTADSGYLTRRLVDVAQDVVTREQDCKTKYGISIKKDISHSISSLKNKLLGRVLATPMMDQLKIKNLDWVSEIYNNEITSEIAEKLIGLQCSRILIRSPLTCELARAICQKCYGWDLTLGNLVDLGAAVGIIAGQSIGEPGTQLTMRTFHTGGVFTSEQSRQIRAENSGKVSFSLGLVTKKARSKVGEPLLISQNIGNIELKNFKNKKKKLTLPPESLIFVENFSFVKKDQSLFELPILSTKTKEDKSLKDVFSQQSGQVILESQDQQGSATTALKKKSFITSLQNLKNKKILNALIWIFSGKVHSIPGQSKIKIKPFSWVQTEQSLAQSNVNTLLGGKVNISFNLESHKLENIEISKFSTEFKNVHFKIEKLINSEINFAIYGTNHRVIYFDAEVSLAPRKKSWFAIGEMKNTKYTTKTGGSFYCKESQLQTKTLTTVFYTPEFSIEIHRPTSELNVKTGDSVIKGYEYLKDNYSKFDGVIEIEEYNNTTEEVVITPGFKIQVPEFYPDIDNLVDSYHEQVFYPGEVLFDKYQISRSCYTELRNFGEKLFLIVAPIVRYEISKENSGLENFDLSVFLPNTIELDNAEVNFFSGQKIRSSQPIQWLSHSILLKMTHTGKNLTINPQLKETNSWFTLSFTTKENFDLNSLIPDEIRREKIVFCSLVENNQYVEPYTSIAFLQILSPTDIFVYSIQQQFFETQRRILLTTNEDYQSLYFEEKNLNVKVNNFFTPGQKLSTNLVAEESGLIDKTQGSKVLIRAAQPYLFSLGGRIQICDGYFIKKEESLGQLFYTRARTEDIVQGLPKVEELLEGRKSSSVSVLAQRPGVISQIQQTALTMKVWISVGISKSYSSSEKTVLDSTLSELYFIKRPSQLVVGLGQFVNVGQPLENKGTNPNTILETFFQYYQNLDSISLYEASLRSVQIVQAVILNSVQNVYSSQGVNISDKHLEIIVRQMTKKVEIISPGETNLFAKELIDFSQIGFINSCLRSENKPFYKPILLGITKASLKTDSFLSKASFQQTTQVLTEAAIEGKADWLRGLKENVITGSLIPAGTGFYSYIDLSHLTTIVPTYKPKSRSKVSAYKYSSLKKRLNFQLACENNLKKPESLAK